MSAELASGAFQDCARRTGHVAQIDQAEQRVVHVRVGDRRTGEFPGGRGLRKGAAAKEKEVARRQGLRVPGEGVREHVVEDRHVERGGLRGLKRVGVSWSKESWLSARRTLSRNQSPRVTRRTRTGGRGGMTAKGVVVQREGVGETVGENEVGGEPAAGVGDAGARGESGVDLRVTFAGGEVEGFHVDELALVGEFDVAGAAAGAEVFGLHEDLRRLGTVGQRRAERRVRPTFSRGESPSLTRRVSTSEAGTPGGSGWAGRRGRRCAFGRGGPRGVHRQG